MSAAGARRVGRWLLIAAGVQLALGVVVACVGLAGLLFWPWWLVWLGLLASAYGCLYAAAFAIEYALVARA